MHSSITNLLLLIALNLDFGEAETSISSAPAATHTVAVGAEGLAFTPNEISAAVGDTVLFLFYPQNHSVARADYAKPCYPYEDSGPGRVGFFSGFNPLNVVSSNPPSFPIVVNDTQPLFFYCSAPGACHDDGMVGVINPNSTQTLQLQVAFAENSTIAFSPGESFPQEGSSSTTTTSHSATPTPTTTPASTSTASGTTASIIPTPTIVVEAKSSSGISGGAIAGIAIGGAFVLLLALTLVYFCGLQCGMAQFMRRTGNEQSLSEPGHLSMASVSTSPAKPPFAVLNPLQTHRFSGNGEFSGHSETENEVLPSPINLRDDTSHRMSATYMPQASRGGPQQRFHELDNDN